MTYQWSNQRVAGDPAPRKRTYTMPWKPEGSTGPYVYYFGVGYDDVHPADIAVPCLATQFARYVCFWSKFEEENRARAAHLLVKLAQHLLVKL